MESEGKMNDGGAGKRDGGGGDFERYAGGEDTRMDMGLIGNIFGQHGKRHEYVDNKTLRLVIKICRRMLLYGAPANRVQFRLQHLCRHFSLPASFVITPTLLFVSLKNSPSHILPCTSGFHLHKLQLLETLIDRVLSENLQEEKIFQKVRQIARYQPTAPVEYLRYFAFFLLSATASSLFFNGTWIDSLCSGGVGMLVGLIYMAATTWLNTSKFFFETLAALIAAFITSTLSNTYNLNFPSIVVSGVLWLLPGLAMLAAVSEMANRLVFEGTFRAIFAALTALAIGYGLTVGSHAAQIFVYHGPESDVVKQNHVHPTYYLGPMLFSALHAFANVLLLRAHPTQWISMILMGVLTQEVSTFFLAGIHMGNEAAILLTAAAMGIISNVHAHVFGVTPIPTTIICMLFIVPGGVGIQGVMRMLDHDVVHGVDFAGQFFRVSVSITIGFMVSNLASIRLKTSDEKSSNTLPSQSSSPASNTSSQSSFRTNIEDSMQQQLSPLSCIMIFFVCTFLYICSLYPFGAKDVWLLH